MFYSTLSRPQPHRYIYVGTPDNLRQRSDVSAERDYAARVGFSGRGSLGVLRRKGERKSEFTPTSQRMYKPDYVEYLHVTECGTPDITRISLIEVTPPGYFIKCFNPSQRLEYLSNFKIRQQYRRRLEAEERRESNRRVAKVLTSRGRNVIANGCSLLEYKYGNRRLGFYTLTCPYSDSEDIQLFNDCYPEILRRYFQELKREYARRDLCFSYVGVYEIQLRRFERTGDKCLHFHYVAPALDSCGGFVLRHESLRYLYARIVRKVCGKDFRHPPRVDAQLVKRSAGGYLCKYFSKGVSVDDETIRVGADVRLSSWYSVARNLLTAIRRTTFELPRCIADDLFRSSAINEKLPYARYIRAIYADVDGRLIHVGCVFQLNGDYLSTLREIVYPEAEHLF